MLTAYGVPFVPEVASTTSPEEGRRQGSTMRDLLTIHALLGVTTDAVPLTSVLSGGLETVLRRCGGLIEVRPHVREACLRPLVRPAQRSNVVVRSNVFYVA